MPRSRRYWLSGRAWAYSFWLAFFTAILGALVVGWIPVVGGVLVVGIFFVALVFFAWAAGFTQWYCHFCLRELHGFGALACSHCTRLTDAGEDRHINPETGIRYL
jgi:hypothetical protein